MIDDIIDFFKEVFIPMLCIGLLIIVFGAVPTVGIAYLLDRTACHQRGEEHNIEVVYRFPAGCILKTSDPDDKVRILSQ